MNSIIGDSSTKKISNESNKPNKDNRRNWPGFQNVKNDDEIPPLKAKNSPVMPVYLVQTENIQKGYIQQPEKYEKNRILKTKEKLEGFEIEHCKPYKWMIKTFSRVITQKEFNTIYEPLKKELQPQFAPQRDENRSQLVRFYWMSNSWDDPDARNTIKKYIKSAIIKEKK